MLTAQQKGLLDLYYRLVTGSIPASAISGTVSPSNLPSSVTADIGTSRIVDGSITQAKLGADVTMIKSITRGYAQIIRNKITDTPLGLALTVNPAKTMVLLSGEATLQTSVQIWLNTDGTDLLYKNTDTTHEFDLRYEIVEFL